jgi:hypothetical protein
MESESKSVKDLQCQKFDLRAQIYAFESGQELTDHTRSTDLQSTLSGLFDPAFLGKFPCLRYYRFPLDSDKAQIVSFDVH